MLHEPTAGLVELAAGVRRDGWLQITTRRRSDHFLPGGGAGGGGWLEALLELAEHHAARGEEVFVAPAVRGAARGEKQAVLESRFLWVDVDRPGQLHALWAFLAERPCHMLIESGGSGGCHAYFRLAEPLPAMRVVAATGELVEPIERAHLRIIHRLGVGEDGRPSVADPACAERSRVLRLAGSVGGKTGAYARIVEADFGSRRTRSRSWWGSPRPGDPHLAATQALGQEQRSVQAGQPARVLREARRDRGRARWAGVLSRARARRSPPVVLGWRLAGSGLVLSLGDVWGPRGDLRPRVGAAWRAGGHQLRGEAFKRARAYVADVFGELIEVHDGTTIGRPGERSRR